MDRAYSLQIAKVQQHSLLGQEPLRIAVLIDHRPNSRREMGGLAGTWEQIARVVCGRPDIDLTLLFPAPGNGSGNLSSPETESTAEVADCRELS